MSGNSNVVTLNEAKRTLKFSLCEDFLNGYSSPNTKRAYVNAIKEFFGVENINEVNSFKIENIIPLQVLNYVTKISANNTSGTIKLKLSGLSALVDYTNWIKKQCGESLVDNPFKDKDLRGRYVKNATKKNQGKDDDYSEIQVLTNNEVDLLLDTILKSKMKDNYRNFVLIAFMLHTGLRRTEVVTIKTDYFVLDDGDWYLYVEGKDTKSGKNRMIYISNELKELVDKLEIGSNNILFPMTSDNIYKILKKALELAGIERELSPHDLRHTAITHCIEDGATVYEAKDFAGHESIETTMRYFHALNKKVNNAGRRLKFVQNYLEKRDMNVDTNL